MDKISSFSQDKMDINGDKKSFQKPSIKSLISMYDPLKHNSMKNDNHKGNQCFKQDTNDKLQSKPKTNSNIKISEINFEKKKTK